jgi:hypothetical protein
MWAERSEREGVLAEPPCYDCKVTLLEENADAARMYQLSRGQVITMFNGEIDKVIDINHVALWQNIERYKARDPMRCFELVTKVFHYFLSKERENAS